MKGGYMHPCTVCITTHGAVVRGKGAEVRRGAQREAGGGEERLRLLGSRRLLCSSTATAIAAGPYRVHNLFTLIVFKPKSQ